MWFIYTIQKHKTEIDDIIIIQQKIKKVFKMQNYNKWQQNKLYIDHLNRLKKITHSPLAKPKKIFRDKKIITEPPVMIHPPIPLVTPDESKLITGTLNSRYIPLRQKQHLLENYLLSRRILSTKSVFNAKQLKRQYRMHRKISRNMSRTFKNVSAMSDSRRTNYESFRKETARTERIGVGKNTLELKINKILLIKGTIQNNSNSLYKVQIQIGSQILSSKPQTYDEMINIPLRIGIKSIYLKKETEMKIEFICQRQNYEHTLGAVCLSLKDFVTEGREPVNLVKKISRGSVPVGTITMEGTIENRM